MEIILEKLKKIIYNDILSFIILFFSIGMVIGIVIGINIYKNKIYEGIRVGGFLYNDTVYQIIEKK